MTASEKPPALEPELVHEFVLKSHGDLETVKRLLGEAPALVNCAWDWGGGDWETGLGAASHVGHREIALFLLDHVRGWTSSPRRCSTRPRSSRRCSPRLQARAMP